jgi:hypothetical protein
MHKMYDIQIYKVAAPFYTVNYVINSTRLIHACVHFNKMRDLRSLIFYENLYKVFIYNFITLPILFINSNMFLIYFLVSFISIIDEIYLE